MSQNLAIKNIISRKEFDLDVKQAILNRRAYRSLERVEITGEMINQLTEAIRLTPSCFNNQPWRYVFVKSSEMLEKMHGTLSRGNQNWATGSSLIIAVLSKKELDCDITGRQYYLFDTGMATAFLMLRATELRLVAHPIAGYNEQQVKEILSIPEDMTVIALLIVGKKALINNPALNEMQINSEKTRPKRLLPEEIVFIDKYKDK
ncbi:MAG: nitroreductase family protein [Candidatus Hodarchaeales archaeon]